MNTDGGARRQELLTTTLANMQRQLQEAAATLTQLEKDIADLRNGEAAALLGVLHAHSGQQLESAVCWQAVAAELAARQQELLTRHASVRDTAYHCRRAIAELTRTRALEAIVERLESGQHE